MHLGTKFLGRDCVAYTTEFQKLSGSKLPIAFSIQLCTYFSNANISGDDASRGHTRSHPEHDG